MSKFGHLTLNMPESLNVKEIKLDGEVVSDVFELNDKEGWLKRYKTRYTDLSSPMESVLLKGEVEIIWDE